MIRLAFALLFLAGASDVCAQAIVQGKVLTSDSIPIAGARVEVKDSAGKINYTTATDSAGNFSLRIAYPFYPGIYFVSSDMIGYRPVVRAPLRIDDRDEVTVHITLDVAVIALEPLRVFTRKRYTRGPRDEYYDRADRIKRMGGGTVIDYDALQRRIGSPLNILIAEALPNTRSCPPSYFIDGMRATPDDIRMLAVSFIEGIEIYRSLAMIPVQYQGRSSCSAVLIWTQIGDRGKGAPLTWRRVLIALGFISLGVMLVR